eukprot:TRINITY_DN1770_c1_g1_i5.p3 TRINITY_DN1770_c1_g1~~TRINITY_DN1770_c1_g1_i5.p3  ORF type:complete len:108 (-),score=1.76 TRINITY_DN1770_c1_g1_i5:738-1061(-)
MRQGQNVLRNVSNYRMPFRTDSDLFRIIKTFPADFKVFKNEKKCQQVAMYLLLWEYQIIQNFQNSVKLLSFLALFQKTIRNCDCEIAKKPVAIAKIKNCRLRLRKLG